MKLPKPEIQVKYTLKEVRDSKLNVIQLLYQELYEEFGLPFSRAAGMDDISLRDSQVLQDLINAASRASGYSVMTQEVYGDEGMIFTFTSDDT